MTTFDDPAEITHEWDLLPVFSPWHGDDYLPNGDVDYHNTLTWDEWWDEWIANNSCCPSASYAAQSLCGCRGADTPPTAPDISRLLERDFEDESFREPDYDEYYREY